MDVECMRLGNVHNAKIFANFSSNHMLQNNLISDMLYFPRQNVNKIITNYIMGDTAYPLLSNCIKE